MLTKKFLDKRSPFLSGVGAFLGNLLSVVILSYTGAIYNEAWLYLIFIIVPSIFVFFMCSCNHKIRYKMLTVSTGSIGGIIGVVISTSTLYYIVSFFSSTVVVHSTTISILHFVIFSLLTTPIIAGFFSWYFHKKFGEQKSVQ